MSSSVFTLTRPSDLDDYLSRCLRYRPNLDLTVTRQSVLDSIKNLQTTEEGKKLEARWYESLEKGDPDYSVYDEDFFIGDVWTCWVLFSRKYLLSLVSDKSLECGDSIADSTRGFVRTVADLGCGFGYSTAGLKEIFPEAKVFGTNIPDTCQWHVAREIGEERDFAIVPDAVTIGDRVDFIFASEYFEHIFNPVEHLEQLINETSPKVFVFANAFQTKAVGHFEIYSHKQQSVPGKNIGRLFSKTLKEYGYGQVKTKLWNNRPNIWVKQ